MSSPSLPNSYPIEIPQPDISAYEKGNTGVPYIWRFDSGQPGPVAMIAAVVHGNEPCGAVAVDWLMQRDFRPLTGTLVLAFMNIAAYHSFDEQDPNASRWVDEDFNRIWADDVIGGDRDSVEMRRAREVQPIVAEVDYLLDIHSMQKAAPPMMMCGWEPKGADLAAMVGVPERVVADRGHASGMRMRDHGAFSDPNSDAAALLIECGQHWEQAAADLALASSARFLVGLGLADASLVEAADGANPPPQDFFEVTEAVTIKSEEFRYAQEFGGGEVLADEGTLLGWDGEREVRTPYPDCMLVMPSRRLWKGQTAVRLARRTR